MLRLCSPSGGMGVEVMRRAGRVAVVWAPPGGTGGGPGTVGPLPAPLLLPAVLAAAPLLFADAVLPVKRPPRLLPDAALLLLLLL